MSICDSPLNRFGNTVLSGFRRAFANVPKPIENTAPVQWCPHAPTPKQAEFLNLDCLEAMYGGAAGGGKSDALLMAAAKYVNVPTYRAIILRRTYADLALPGAIMDRAKEWWIDLAEWSEKEKTFRFPSGATISFGYLEHENDKFRYQGSEFQFVAFDELTQFSETQYLYLFSRLRKVVGVDVPLRMRSASNPGGVGHGWVRERFVVNRTGDRQFIAATLRDNPFINHEEYTRSLSELDPFTRKQLLEGDWTNYTGGLFYRNWFQIVDSAPPVNWEARPIVPEGTQEVRFWDLAGTAAKQGTDPDWTAGVRMRRVKDDIFIIDVRRLRDTPGNVKNTVIRAAEEDGKRIDIWMEEEPGSSGKFVIEDYTKALRGYTFHGEKATGDKATRAKPLSSYAEAGHVYIVRAPWNQAFLDELELFPHGAHDDQVDAAAGAFNKLSKPKRRLMVS